MAMLNNQRVSMSLWFCGRAVHTRTGYACHDSRMTAEAASAKGRKDLAAGLGQVGTIGRGLRQITLDKDPQECQPVKIGPKVWEGTDIWPIPNYQDMTNVLCSLILHCFLDIRGLDAAPFWIVVWYSNNYHTFSFSCWSCCGKLCSYGWDCPQT